MTRRDSKEVAKQMGVEDKSTTFRIIDPAILPMTPANQQRPKKILFGIIGGLVGSLALLILRDYLDSTIRRVDTLKSMGVHVLAVVPKIETAAEQQTSRRRDMWFFAITGTYFIGFMATVSIKFMR